MISIVCEPLKMLKIFNDVIYERFQMRRRSCWPANAIAKITLTELDAIDAKTDIGISRSKIRMDVKVKKLGRFLDGKYVYLMHIHTSFSQMDCVSAVKL